MAAARGAHLLSANHPVARVVLLVDRLLARRRGERGPAAAGVVLGLRAEELGATARTRIGAGLENVVVLTRERRFRPLLAQDAVLLGIELCAPLRIGLDHLGQSVSSRF